MASNPEQDSPAPLLSAQKLQTRAIEIAKDRKGRYPADPRAERSPRFACCDWLSEMTFTRDQRAITVILRPNTPRSACAWVCFAVGFTPVLVVESPPSRLASNPTNFETCFGTAAPASRGGGRRRAYFGHQGGDFTKEGLSSTLASASAITSFRFDEDELSQSCDCTRFRAGTPSFFFCITRNINNRQPRV